MAKKPSITTIASGYASTTTLNANFEALREGFDNTLSLDGSTPNAMGADLDMNGNSITGADAIYVGGEDIVVSTATALAAAETAQADAEAAVTAAENSEAAAALSESNAASSATSAAASKVAAAASETAAAASEAAAAISATTAETHKTAAAVSASAASTSETNAAASETAADASETAAATSASQAATSASNAATSASQAASSASSASTSATNAANSASAASTSETNAASSASAAATSESNAATSESNAASSASAASTSETNAANSASAAATSASNAATSETNAATSATNAAGSASSAQTAADAALAALDSFDDRYLGQKASDPTLDNDGNPLVAGALYFNTTDEIMKVYDGSLWVAAYASLSGAMFGANNLSDVASASDSRANLGLGSAALSSTTDFAAASHTHVKANITDFSDGDYATAAQGLLADSATQPGDNISTLTNDSGYISGNQTITLTGDVSGSGTTSISVTIADDSHNHVISNIDGLQTALDGKLSTTGKAADSEKVDGINGASLLRSDVADTKTAGDLGFSDNVKATFGNSSDLQVYHNGSDSFIDDAGTGNLNIRGSSVVQIGKYTGEVAAQFIADGEVNLRYNNSEKLATTSTGISVTGTVAATAFTGDGSGLTGVEATKFNAVSGTSQTLDVGSYNFFNGGEITASTSVSFSNVPTEAAWTYTVIASPDTSVYSPPTNVWNDEIADQKNIADASDFEFSPDGTKLFIIYYNDGIIKEYSLSTPFTFSTASANPVATKDISGDAGNARGMCFGNNGYYLFVWNADSEYIYRFSMSTPYSIATLNTAANQTWYAPGYLGTITCYGMEFSPDGRNIYLANYYNLTRLFQVRLGTAWDLSSSKTYIGALQVSDYGGTHCKLDFSDDGTQMFWSSNPFNQNLYKYTLSTPYDITTAGSPTGMWTNGTWSETWPFTFAPSYDGFIYFASGQTFYKIKLSPAPTLSLPPQVINENQPTLGYNSYSFYTNDGGSTVRVTSEKLG